MCIRNNAAINAHKNSGRAGRGSLCAIGGHSVSVIQYMSCTSKLHSHIHFTNKLEKKLQDEPYRLQTDPVMSMIIIALQPASSREFNQSEILSSTIGPGELVQPGPLHFPQAGVH